VKVTFVIPLFNCLPLTQAMVASLQATLPPGLEHEIILVDDGSTDGTRSWLATLAPPFRVVLNPRNLGYAAANNRGAALATGRFLALLNNDLILTPHWLGPMLAAFDRHPRAGVVGNIQVQPETLQVDHAGIVFYQGGYPIHHREPLASVQAAGDFIEMPAVTAACCIVDRGWFCRRGGFDESYRNGFEDVDLCLRAREDGWANLVATASVVQHHGSQSAGRGAHEFRNAALFLSHWGPRTAALETEWNLKSARVRAAADARRFFSPLPRRLGFGPAALRRQHRAALAADQRAHQAATRPVRIGIDLLRMQPGGANGGIKPLVYSFLTEIARQRGPAINFAVLAQPALREELGPVLHPGDFLLEPGPNSLAVFRQRNGIWHPSGRLPLDGTMPTRAGFDALYAPFGSSQFTQPGLPTVSLIVDLLHRDLPAALPVEEVNYRHVWFTQVAKDAAYIQCLSRHAIGRLVAHYAVPPSRCFHTYLPVHDRLPEPAPDVPPPSGTAEAPFFFYPANFWPHKNHETLLVAYRTYAIGAGSRAWPLVLTGQPDLRMKQLAEMADGLGLAGRVRFLGHVGDAAFAALWKRAGAMVFPSLHEGFGIPLLEAMRFGVPILAANATALPEVAGDACLSFDPGDPHLLADAMRRIAIREGLRKDLVKRGHDRLAAFSLEMEASRLAHFLEAAARRQTP
jgi:GT2 family glycosyltransferase/glycosyltransferase involved in cell wall biosynthesis